MSPRRPEAACLLLLNGEVPDPGLLLRAARRARLVICADGGLRHAAALGLSPHFVVGDMDSLPQPLPLKSLRRAVFWCDFDDSRSDLEKSLRFAADMGCRRFYVGGAVGGRLDHALVNLSVLGRYGAALDLILLDRGAARLLGPGGYRLGLRAGAVFSLLAAPQARVTLAGARYPLEAGVLESGSRGLSNRALGPVRLTVHEGRAWFVSETLVDSEAIGG